MIEKDKYNLMFSYKEEGEYDKAIKGFIQLLELKNRTIPENNLLFQIGGCYYFDQKYSKALNYFLRTQEIDNCDEAISLGIYLSYVKLNKTEDAINELKRFSSKYSINLYIDTIEELLEGLENGFMTDFESEIKQMAHENSVSIKPNAASDK